MEVIEPHTPRTPLPQKTDERSGYGVRGQWRCLSDKLHPPFRMRIIVSDKTSMVIAKPGTVSCSPFDTDIRTSVVGIPLKIVYTHPTAIAVDTPRLHLHLLRREAVLSRIFVLPDKRRTAFPSCASLYLPNV